MNNKNRKSEHRRSSVLETEIEGFKTSARIQDESQRLKYQYHPFFLTLNKYFPILFSVLVAFLPTLTNHYTDEVTMFSPECTRLDKIAGAMQCFFLFFGIYMTSLVILSSAFTDMDY